MSFGGRGGGGGSKWDTLLSQGMNELHPVVSREGGAINHILVVWSWGEGWEAMNRVLRIMS